MTATTEETFGSTGHVNIFFRSWLPEDAARAVVVICHGFNAHGGQYAWVAARLAERGFAVYAPDLRGRGRSDGERFYVEDIADYVDDLGGAIAIAKSRHPGLKIFLLGHSAGRGHRRHLCAGKPGGTGRLHLRELCLPGAGARFPDRCDQGLAHVAPHLGVLKLKNADFSRDPAVVAALDADPYIKDETQPAATVAALARADERLRDSFPAITIPLLILHGTDDHATVCHGSEFFHETAGSSDKTLNIYEGHYHDLLADLGKDSVMGDVLAWIDARV